MLKTSDLRNMLMTTFPTMDIQSAIEVCDVVEDWMEGGFDGPE